MEIKETQENLNNKKIKTGLTLGIIGLFAWFIPLIGFPITIIGLIFSIKASKTTKKKTAIWAMTLSIIGLFLTIVNASIGAYMGATGQHTLVNKIMNNQPVFNWIYEKDSSLNPDGGNQTNIFLEIKYLNNPIQKKFIETFPGQCYELSNPDQDIVKNSKNIQCYYAGYGYKFKIIKQDNFYEVKRQLFEEGSAEYTPTKQNYETVIKFEI